MGRSPAIFLDRDGVINENPEFYVKSWAEFRFLPGVLEALCQLAQLPWLIFIVTNQSVIGREIISEDRLATIHTKMLKVIQSKGGRIDGIYICPHKPEDGCDCRKPRPGLLYRAAHDHQIDLERSILIGDSMVDIEAAQAVGMPAVLINSTSDDSNNRHHYLNARTSYIQTESLIDAAEALVRGFSSSEKTVSPFDLMVYFAKHGQHLNKTPESNKGFHK